MEELDPDYLLELRFEFLSKLSDKLQKQKGYAQANLIMQEQSSAEFQEYLRMVHRLSRCVLSEQERALNQREILNLKKENAAMREKLLPKRSRESLEAELKEKLAKLEEMEKAYTENFIKYTEKNTERDKTARRLPPYYDRNAVIELEKESKVYKDAYEKAFSQLKGLRSSVTKLTNVLKKFE